MDQERFDRITRTLATGRSRRGVLRGLGVSLAGLLATGRHVGQANHGGADTGLLHPNPGSCPPDTKPCVTQIRRGKSLFNVNTACCPAGQVCYKCAASDSPRSSSISITVTECCTPGVDCPGDPGFGGFYDDASGRHLTICREVLG